MCLADLIQMFYMWNGVEVSAILLNQINMYWVLLMYKIPGDTKVSKVTLHTYYLLPLLVTFLCRHLLSLCQSWVCFLDFYSLPFPCSVLCYRGLALTNWISQASCWVGQWQALWEYCGRWGVLGEREHTRAFYVKRAFLIQWNFIISLKTKIG